MPTPTSSTTTSASAIGSVRQRIRIRAAAPRAWIARAEDAKARIAVLQRELGPAPIR